MKKLFIASNNGHKIEEIADILKRNQIEIELVCPKDFDCKEEPVENGRTFAQNARIKAQFYYDRFHLPTIADDSGICIDYLKRVLLMHLEALFLEIKYMMTRESKQTIWLSVRNVWKRLFSSISLNRLLSPRKNMQNA